MEISQLSNLFAEVWALLDRLTADAFYTKLPQTELPAWHWYTYST
jgi:hypothetical protein